MTDLIQSIQATLSVISAERSESQKQDEARKQQELKWAQAAAREAARPKAWVGTRNGVVIEAALDRPESSAKTVAQMKKQWSDWGLNVQLVYADTHPVRIGADASQMESFRVL